MMGKLSEKLNAIFGKVDNIENRYEVAIEKKQESLILLQQELQDKKIQNEELKKMYLLAEIEESYFEENNQAFQLLQDKYNKALEEIDIMQKFKTDDVTTLLEEMKAKHKEHLASHHDEIREMQKELLQAKAEYLNKMAKMKERYDKTVEPVNNIQRLEQKLGLRQHTYTSSSHDGLNNIRVGETSFVNLQVNAPEIFEALQYGKINQYLQQVITDMKA